MNVCRRTTQFLSYFIAIAFTLLFAHTTFAQAPENNQMMLEGSLTDANGNPINLSGVQLIFYVTASNGCYLYGEKTTTAGDSQGNISYRIGSGTLVSGSPNGFTQSIFFGAANGTTTFAGNNCTVTASDTRLVQVYYQDQNITGTIKLASVPYAYNAKLLNGLSSADFIQVTNDSNTLFYSGTSGQYLTKSASGALAWTTISNSVTSSSISSALGYVPASNTSLTAAAINTALGYTPAASAALTSNQVTTALGYTPAMSGATITANQVTTALGYTPANSATVASLTSSVTTSFTALTSQITTVSSTVTTLKNSVAASISAIVSSQWTTSFSNIYYTAGNVGIGMTNPVSKLDVSGSVRISMDSSTCSPSLAGALRYNSGSLEMCNGSAWNSFGMAGAGITSLNGSTASTQNFAVGNMGMTPAFTTSAGTHTLNIPLAATASVTAGLISNSDYTNFNNKITSSAVAVAQALGYTPANSSTLANYALLTNNLSDLTSATIARTNLGLGALATKGSVDLSTSDATGFLALARLPSLGGDVSSVSGSNSVTVAKLRGVDVSSGTPTVGQVLTYSSGKWMPSTPTTGTITQVTAGNGLNGGSITTSGTISVNFGTASGTVAQGNDSRITGALQSANNLFDIASATAARTNLGLGALAVKDQVQLNSDVAGVLPVANGGSKWTTFASGIYTTSNTVIGTNSISATSVRLYVEANSTAQAARFTNTNPNGLGVRIDTMSTSSTQYALNVNNTSGTMFLVQSDGNIGMGTLSPATVLNIVNDNGPSYKDDIQINTYGNNTAALALQRAKGTAAAPTPLLANEAIGNLRWDGYVGSAHTNLVAITGYAESDLATGVNSYLTITTNSSGTMAERVRVTSTGNVGIGTASATAAKLHVAGAIVSKPQTVAGTAVDLAQSNMFILNSIGGTAGTNQSIALNNMVDGGTYTLIITDTTVHTYTFSGCTNQFFAPANSQTVAGTRTMYGLVTIKNGASWDCYINWTPGYQ